MFMNTCQRDLVQCLAASGGWLNRADLGAALAGRPWNAARVDDDLAVLVEAGRAVYNERARQYRLAGAPLARAALKRLIEQGPEHRRVVLGRQAPGTLSFQVAVACRLSAPAPGGDEFVMVELELDAPEGFVPRVEWGLRVMGAIEQYGASA